MQGVSKVLGSSGWRVGGTYHTKDVRCSFDYSCPIAIRISECRRISDSIATRWPRVGSLAASKRLPGGLAEGAQAPPKQSSMRQVPNDRDARSTLKFGCIPLRSDTESAVYARPACPRTVEGGQRRR